MCIAVALEQLAICFCFCAKKKKEKKRCWASKTIFLRIIKTINNINSRGDGDGPFAYHGTLLSNPFDMVLSACFSCYPNLLSCITHVIHPSTLPTYCVCLRLISSFVPPRLLSIIALFTSVSLMHSLMFLPLRNTIACFPYPIHFFCHLHFRRFRFYPIIWY